MDNNELVSIGLFWNKNMNMLKLLKLQTKIESILQEKYYLCLSSRSDLLDLYFYDKDITEIMVNGKNEIYIIHINNTTNSDFNALVIMNSKKTYIMLKGKTPSYFSKLYFQSDYPQTYLSDSKMICLA